MGLPVSVVNWEELTASLKDHIDITINGDIDIDFGPTQAILEKYLPELKALIEQILGQRIKKGTQKIRGDRLMMTVPDEYAIVFTPQRDILITGLTYWQDDWSGGDRFGLRVQKDQVTIPIIEGLFAKDVLQEKLIDPWFPVPAGYTVQIAVDHSAHRPVDVRTDLAYLELGGDTA